MSTLLAPSTALDARGQAQRQPPSLDRSTGQTTLSTNAAMSERLHPFDHDAACIDRLVLRAQDGDREAFRELVLQTQTEIRLAIAWRITSPDLVEELVQETYVIAFQRLASYRAEGTFIPWLKGIARIQIAKEHQARARRRQVGLGDDFADLAAPEDDAHDDAAAISALNDCLEQLKPRARLLVQRRYSDGLPIAVLARQFKQKENSLAVTLMRIRATLRNCLGAKGLST